jgi:peptidoglycan/LPS O-acetylase OafA/YrhL
VLVLHNSEYYAVKSLLHDFIFYNPVMHLNAFLAGFLTGVFFKEKQIKPLKYNTIWLLFSVILIVLLLMYRETIETILGLQIAYGNGLIAPAFLLFIVLLAQEKGMISSVLSNKWLILLGEASFSLYILQKPLHGVYDKLIVARIELPALVHFYIFLLLLIAVSILSYKYFETPMRKFINNRYAS